MIIILSLGLVVYRFNGNNLFIQSPVVLRKWSWIHHYLVAVFLMGCYYLSDRVTTTIICSYSAHYSFIGIISPTWSLSLGL